MKKEVWLAIFLGLMVGILISLGIYIANRALKTKRLSSNIPQTTSLSSPLPSPSSLIINEPENNLVFKVNEATISGQAKPEATIAILAENQEDLLMADKQGFFSTKISLISGLNEIKIVAIDNNANQEEKIIQLVYSTTKIE